MSPAAGISSTFPCSVCAAPSATGAASATLSSLTADGWELKAGCLSMISLASRM